MNTAEAKLSCWAWYVGKPNDRFDFGAHDFRGGSSTTDLQVNFKERIYLYETEYLAKPKTDLTLLPGHGRVR